MAIILASGSPRRRELLEMLGARDMLVIPAKGDEVPPRGAGPGDTVKALSRAKTLEVAEHRPAGDVIIGADTIVWLDGRVLGKPHLEREAAEMLNELSGRAHEVWTGVCIARGGEVLCEAERTEVRFRELSGREIAAYIATGEPMDKAGAYGAQGLGALFVERIDGDFFNVMGLPLCRLGRMLKKLGVELL